MNGTIVGLLTLFMWGCSALLVANIGRLPPLEVTAFSWVITCIALTGFYVWRGDNIAQYFRRPFHDYLFVTSGIGVYTILYYVGFKYAPVFEANALNYLWPILLMLFISIFQKAPMTIYAIIGMAMGFGGSLLLFAAKAGGFAPGSFGFGHVITIIAAIIWALYSCFSRGKKYPPGFLMPVFLLSGAGTFAMHFALEETVMPTHFEWIIIFVIGLQRLGYVSWDYAMRNGNQLLVTSASYFTPLLSTIVLSLGGFGATSGSILLAAALIISGCLVVNGQNLKKIPAYLKRKS